MTRQRPAGKPRPAYFISLHRWSPTWWQ